MQRVHTPSRDDQDSELIGWIRGHTNIGPSLQGRVTCCLHQYGIEIQSTFHVEKGSSSWIVISRDPNRFVDESWHDQEDPPQDIEMVSSTSGEQSHAVTSSIEETHASKPQEQSIPMNYFSTEVIPIDRTKWNGLLACDNVEGFSLAWETSKR